MFTAVCDAGYELNVTIVKNSNCCDGLCFRKREEIEASRALLIVLSWQEESFSLVLVKSNSTHFVAH